jgi:hypothetical protein
MSYRKNVISKKCHIEKMSFRKNVISKKCHIEKMSYQKNFDIQWNPLNVITLGLRETITLTE